MAIIKEKTARAQTHRLIIEPPFDGNFLMLHFQTYKAARKLGTHKGNLSDLADATANDIGTALTGLQDVSQIFKQAVDQALPDITARTKEIIRQHEGDCLLDRCHDVRTHIADNAVDAVRIKLGL
ncbi:MAG: hypothetical protein H6867_06950 [Rhodospirillales bacterium]|nr:hypothetical protein [Rhodospirillales bacterium]MCB9995287.1 hypothetical protein [Rhodospirillales bacterium]